MCGFDRDAGQFLIFFSVTLLIQFLAMTFATLCVSFSRKFGEASLIGNLAYTVCTLAYLSIDRLLTDTQRFNPCPVDFLSKLAHFLSTSVG